MPKLSEVDMVYWEQQITIENAILTNNKQAIKIITFVFTTSKLIYYDISMLITGTS